MSNQRQQRLTEHTDSNPMADPELISRAHSALDEIDAGEMSIEDNGDGTFTVKGDYEVDPSVPKCSCKDFEYRVDFCKHIVAVTMQDLWGNVDAHSGGSDAPPRPDVIEMEYDSIPHTLRGMDHWVCWKQKLIENKDGSQRWTKVPVDVESGGFASSTDPETWTDYTNAASYCRRSDTDAVGLGFVVSEDDAVIGIDIDDCRDPDSGDIDPVVVELLRHTETYAEVSPSGTGIRIFVLGDSTVEECEADLPREAHIEMYDTGRYLTVTGHSIDYCPDDLEWDDDTLSEFEARVSGGKTDLSEFGA